MTFPALRYEVDEHLVAGMRALYDASERLRRIPLDKLSVHQVEVMREALFRSEALKDLLYEFRFGEPREDDVPPTDLIGGTSRRLSPVTKRIFELLGDGKWHDYDEVVREAAKEVLPGEAHRHMEESRKASSRTDQRTVPRDDLYLVERGQRAIAVNAMAGQDRIELDPPTRTGNEKRWARLRPPNIYRTTSREMPDASTIRAWARDNGYHVAAAGELPNEVKEAYRAAHSNGQVQ